jgi:oligoribonuclease NrnB/cAMP/cGMP phosphodiesterase (DHH superfamily)
MMEFVDAIDAYDRWLLGHPLRERGEDLNRLFDFYGREDFVEKFSGDLMLNEFDARKILKYLRKNEKRQIDRGVASFDIYKDGQGREYGIALPTGRPNETAERILNENPHLFYVVIPDSLQGTMQLRSKGKVDVSAIAKTFGGGGHLKSAGFPYDSKKFLFEHTRILFIEGMRAKENLSDR